MQRHTDYRLGATAKEREREREREREKIRRIFVLGVAMANEAVFVL